MLISYPAIFYYDEEDNNPGYFIHFPDIPAAGTQGTSIDDGMEMASDWLGIQVAHYFENDEVPPSPSSVNDLSPEKTTLLRTMLILTLYMTRESLSSL